MKIQITVDCEPGEECTWVSDITREEMEILDPLLMEIKKRNGYYPTEKFLDPSDPKPEELYSMFPGFEILRRRLPSPLSGIGKIREIDVFTGEIFTLYI